MYGYVYMTTCNLNHKRYIGKHAKSEFDKNYYGSSLMLKEDIRKLGKENFSVEILAWADSKEELENLESYWISEFQAVYSEEYYNVYPAVKRQGYSGEDSYWHGKHFSDEHKKALSESHKGIQAGAKNPRARSVVQLSISGKLVRTYQYLKQTEQFGFVGYYISDCCKGKRKSYKGFKWMWVEDYNKQNA